MKVYDERGNELGVLVDVDVRMVGRGSVVPPSRSIEARFLALTDEQQDNIMWVAAGTEPKAGMDLPPSPRINAGIITTPMGVSP